MKYKKYLVQAVIALILSIAVMGLRGAFEAGAAVSDRVMAISDGFTVTALLFISLGALIWISTTGFFDIFSYAFKKAARVFVPGAYMHESANYYDHVINQKEKRKDKKKRREESGWEETSEASTLIVGIGALILSLIFLGIWYAV